MVWVRNRKFTSTWKNTCATFLHRHPREVRVSQIFQKMCEKHRETTGQQRLTEWDSSSQCCVWHNVMSAAQHCCVLTCVDINTHSRPHSHCSHTHTHTEKLLSTELKSSSLTVQTLQSSTQSASAHTVKTCHRHFRQLRLFRTAHTHTRTDSQRFFFVCFVSKSQRQNAFLRPWLWNELFQIYYQSFSLS